jgi:hypothetical protein
MKKSIKVDVRFLLLERYDLNLTASIGKNINC